MRCLQARDAFAAALVVLMATELPRSTAVAGEERTGHAPQCSCPDASQPPAAQPRPAEIKPLLDSRDEAAALEAIQLALTEVGDGSTYVWYRHGGRLSGLVQPTQSFRDALGRVCRHVVVTLNDASRSKRAEGIACRLADGIWELDG
jgi:hypothetical protein